MPSVTCPVCNGRKGRASPARDGGIDFMACARCGGRGSIWLPDPPPVHPPPVRPPPIPRPNDPELPVDPLAGTWMMDGGSWTFTPTASGYVFVEHGALGQMGEGTATLTGNVARLTFLRRVLGPRNIEVSLNGPVMVGTQKVLFINVPFQALRVEP